MADRVEVRLNGKRVLTETQAAELLGWHRVSIRRLVGTGALKVVAHLGRLPLIKFGDVEAYAKASPWKSNLFPGKPRSPGSK